MQLRLLFKKNIKKTFCADTSVLSKVWLFKFWIWCGVIDRRCGWPCFWLASWPLPWLAGWGDNSCKLAFLLLPRPALPLESCKRGSDPLSPSRPRHTVLSKSFTCSPFPSPARPPLELEHSAKVVFKLRAAGGLQRVGFKTRDRPRCWGASSLGSRPPWQGELPYQPASFPPLSSSLSIQLSTVSDPFSPVLSSSSITEDGLSEKKLFPFSARPVAGKR